MSGSRMNSEQHRVKGGVKEPKGTRPRAQAGRAETEQGKQAGPNATITGGKVAAAVQRVLAGDVNAYEQVYRACDNGLRAFIAARYGHLGAGFVDEVAVRTHERVFLRLDRFNPDKGASFQTWMNWQALSVAREVIEERFGVRRVRDRTGRRRDAPRFEAFDEEVHAEYVPTQPGPEELREREERSRLLWQEYNSLAEQGRLSIACHDLEGRTFVQTARRLGVCVSRVRRERERALAVLRRRLQEHGIRPFEAAFTKALRFRAYGQSMGEDDDWCASVTARLPDGPPPLADAAAKRMTDEF